MPIVKAYDFFNFPEWKYLITNILSFARLRRRLDLDGGRIRALLNLGYVEEGTWGFTICFDMGRLEWRRGVGGRGVFFGRVECGVPGEFSLVEEAVDLVG